MIYILIGISGSGKSTWAQNRHGAGEVTICSADHYHTDYNEELGEKTYNYDNAAASTAHGNCLARYIHAIQGIHQPRGTLLRCASAIIVDNTNLTIAEIAPYLEVAKAYGLQNYNGLELRQFKCSLETARQRNVHGINTFILQRQLLNQERLERAWPHWWPIRTVVNTDPAEGGEAS